MKLVTCDGRQLEVRDVGAVIYRLVVAGSVPIKLQGDVILEDDAARKLLCELRKAGTCRPQ